MLGSLDDWEKWLKPQVAQVDLLGEIDIPEEDLRCLGRLIKRLICDEGYLEASDCLQRRYPCTYAVFLVALGVHHYRAGDFWSAVREVTGLEISSTHIPLLGQAFEEAINKLPVARVPRLSKHRYVGLILAHGGIPNYCLVDFFEKFLQPLVRRPEYASLSVPEFIRKQLEEASVVYTTDKPVLRFLQYGGSLAVDFLERCREMALRYIQEKEKPSPEALGLPPRIVEAYEKWCQGKTYPHHPVPSRTVYHTPELFLDPWDSGIGLWFPSQPIPALDADRRILWRISPHDDPEVFAEIWKEGTEWKTFPQKAFLSRRAKEYRVALVLIRKEGMKRSEEILREWWIAGVHEKQPILWFDPRDGRLLKHQDALPKECLWVLRHAGVVLKASPQGSLRVLERFPDLSWEWREFIGEKVDLSSVQSLQAHWKDSVWEYIVVDKAQSQPFLDGGECLPIGDESLPFYRGHPPALHIPLPFHGRDFLDRFYVEVQRDGSSTLEKCLSGSLSCLNPQILNGEAVLDLHTMLGKKPAGIYRIKVLGPLGYKANLAFCILPFLEIVGHETLYLPGENQKANLLVETDKSTTLSVQAHASDCKVTLLEENDTSRLYEVIADATCGDFPLELLFQTSQSVPVRVPFSVPIRRLRWMIALGPEWASNPEWNVVSERLPLKMLEEAQDPFLLIDVFGGINAKLTIRLSLQDETGTVLQEVENRCKPGQRHVRFNLSAFLDTLRQAGLSLASFYVTIEGLPDQEMLSFAVLEVTQRFAVQAIQAEVCQMNELLHLSLHWKASGRVPHRFVLLWPLWRPWELPVKIPIPDEARDSHRLVLPRLIPGKYFLEIGRLDGQTLLTWPGKGMRSGAEIFLPPDALEKRLKEIEEEVSRTGSTFLNLLERALIWHDAGQKKLASRALERCVEHLERERIEHVLAFLHAPLPEYGLDGPLGEKLISHRLIQSLLDGFSQGLLSETQLREYLRRLPSPSSWPEEACRFLLGANDQDIRCKALRQLIERKSTEGANILFHWLQTDQISEEKAMDVVEGNLSWLMEQWGNELHSSSLCAFLEKAHRRYPDQIPLFMVRPGYWVRCVAGWGRIERIETQNGEPCGEFSLLSGENSPFVLYVSLRAHDPTRAEKVVISLGERTVLFVGAEKVYTCSKCQHFSSRNSGLVTGEHDRRVHGGIRPGYCFNPTPIVFQTTPLVFLDHPPSEPWE